MQSSSEQQGEVRKPSSVINAKKQRKTTEWERLEISSRKLRNTTGTFHAKMDSIKDRNRMGLKEAEDIKWWQEDTGGANGNESTCQYRRCKCWV